MTRNITHVHATKNSTELRNSVHVDPIVKFKVSKKSDWLIDRTTHFPREYKKHTIGEEKTKLLSEISTKKLENFNDQDLENYFAEKVGGQDGSIWAWLWETSSTYRQSLKKDIWIYK